MSKIIQINPALFSFSGGGGGTRKKRAANPNMKIKVKSQNQENNKTTKRALLKYIRNQQEKNFEKNMKTDKEQLKTNALSTNETDRFNTNFEESLQFLGKMTDQNEQKPNHMNRTLRNPIGNPVIGNPIQPPIFLGQMPFLDQPPELQQIMNPTMNHPTMNYPMPQHGCLKNGCLPTFRSWKTQTQKNTIVGSTGSSSVGSTGGSIVGSTGGSNNNMNLPNMKLPQMNLPNMNLPNMNLPNMNLPPMNGGIRQSHPISQEPISQREHELNQNIKKMSEINQLSDKIKVHKKKGIYYPKQKRTLRRTYTVGKSKVFPKISVLVSNKTIRNNISTKTQLLKQVPMPDVKKYLIKHGFIRVGTVAPNDVLRKMYESAILICGNINNHNPDNLLYNYFNDKE